jgi:hypothetical protein
MSHHKRYPNESQDARRHDQNTEVHPEDALPKNKVQSLTRDKHIHRKRKK